MDQVHIHKYHASCHRNCFVLICAWISKYFNERIVYIDLGLMQSQVMLPSLQAVHFSKEFFFIGWPPSLAAIQHIAFIGDWPFIFHKLSLNGKVTSMRVHLKGFVKLRELKHRGWWQLVLELFKGLLTKIIPNLANSFLQQVGQRFRNLGEVAYEPHFIIFQAKEYSQILLHRRLHIIPNCFCLLHV
jgi:hypothetical protein